MILKVMILRKRKFLKSFNDVHFQGRILIRANLVLIYSLIVATFLIYGCVNVSDGSVRWLNTEILKANDDEIARKQKMLLNMTFLENEKNNFEKEIVFDGCILELEKDSKTGLNKSYFQINNLLFGNYSGDTIIIFSPSVDNGGIDFVVKKYYRVMAVYLKNGYRTWASTGTVEVNSEMVGNKNKKHKNKNKHKKRGLDQAN